MPSDAAHTLNCVYPPCMAQATCLQVLTIGKRFWRSTTRGAALLDAIMCPLCMSEKLGIMPKPSDQLNSDRQTLRTSERRQGHAWESEQRPAAVEDGAPSNLEPLRCFTRRAWRKQNIKFVEYPVDHPAALGRDLKFSVICFRCASHALLHTGTQRRRE